MSRSSVKNEPKPSAGVVTRRDLARAAGVSLPTVSFALTNHPRVSLKTREHIAATAARLGYVPNHAARRLARSRANSRTSASFEQIGFLYLTAGPFTPDAVCAAMMHGAEQELSAADACLMFVPMDQRGWDKVERLVRSGVVDGWLVGGVVDDEAIDRLKRLGVPHVVLGDHRCTRPVHSVNIDNFGVGRMAAHHLADLGHGRIGFIGGTLGLAYQIERLEGFRAGLHERGVEQDERLIFRTGVNPWITSRDEPPTALFAVEPQSGDRLRRALAEKHIEIPQQMSILVCEITATTVVAPNVTRIELPMQAVGRQGAMLLQKTASEPDLSSSELKIAPAFVDCGSTRSLHM